MIILDLDMPISDGWEACFNISNLFSQNKLFKINEKPADEGINMSNVGVNLAQPIMIAASALMDEET